MKHFQILLLIIIGGILVACSTESIENKYESNFEDDFESRFVDNKYAQVELGRLDYIESVYRYTKLTGTEFYEAYLDSIVSITETLSNPNLDGLSYSKDSLKTATTHFIKSINSLYNSEQDLNAGTEYYRYKQDEINYEIMCYYFRLKSF